MRHALIMAGGSGTRLWPLSRRLRPKQLLKLFNGRSLLQIARERHHGLVAADEIWVITAAEYLDQVAEALPDVPPQNLIGEPVGRDTANAIGLASHLIARADADATIAVFTADHIIEPQSAFHAAVDAGLAAAEQLPDHLVTFGIRPSSPATGYGYVRRGAAVAPGVHRVAEFKEKPARDVAEQYLASGEYCWNSGMFAWRAAAILDALRQHLPQNAAALEAIAADWSSPRRAAAESAFGRLPKISIDYGVMEKAERVLVVDMDVEWRDVGSWTALAETRPADEAGNTVSAPLCVLDGARRNVVVSDEDHLIVAIGVEDLVIVHSPDATLVCRRDEVERLKDIVARRRAAFGERFE